MDPIFELDWGRRWAQMLPGATFDVIESASHFVAEEAGHDVAEAILRRAR